MKSPQPKRFASGALAFLLSSLCVACGGSSNGLCVGPNCPAQQGPPPTPTGLTAAGGNQQVALTWNASAGASSYNVSRSTTSGGPYTKITSPTATTYTDTTVTNGTTYYYVVSAANIYGTSANSTQVSAIPAVSVTNVSVTVDILTNRHAVSPFIYGVNFPPDAAYITNTNTTLVRWGGNASSTYNWQLGSYNADNDYFFEDFNFSALNNPADSNSTQFIKDVKAAGGSPLMTMAMLPWVAQTPENGGNGHWSFSVAKYGSQCHVDPFNTDAGDGLKADCSTPLLANPNDAYFPLLDGPPQAGDPPNSVYRNQWASALATAFGGGSCPTVYFANPSCHFYDMDNEIDIWDGTHFDVHPSTDTYDELRDIYLLEAGNLKAWDPQAVRFGWVSCCWYFYWNTGAGTPDKQAHANVDFMPWWLNEIYWRDQISGSRTLDVFDIHAYPETNGNGLTLSQQQALAVNITRDWWDPNYTSQAWFGSNSVTSGQPLDHVPFRIQRARAWANAIYPGTPLGFTEWNFAMASLSPSANHAEGDFSTALADADAFGILGRERATYSTRWTAADPANPAYNSLKLYRNYDGSNSTFDPISVSATHNASPGLFSVYAATNIGGNSLTLMVVNKDPANTAQVQFTLNHFTPSQFTSYTLSQASPSAIVSGTSQAWPGNSTLNFAPYSATLLVVSGSTTTLPADEWDLNPDTIMVPAGGTINLHPKLVSGAGTVTLGSPSSQAGVTVTTTGSTVNAGQQGSVQVTAGNTPGFYSFTVPATDSSGVSTTQGGWIVVGNPAASLAKTAGDNQSGTAGTVLPVSLSVTLSPGASGGTAAGASVFFTTSAGSLTNVSTGNGEKIFTGSKVIALTNSSGVASVMLTLPGAGQQVQVTAEGPFGLGHPVVMPFTETAQ